MFKLPLNSVLATEIADYLGQPLIGKNMVVYGPATLDTIGEHSIVFLDADSMLPSAKSLGQFSELLFLSPKDLGEKFSHSFIVSANPEFDFVQVLKKFFTRPVAPYIDSAARIDPNARLGQNVSVHSGSFIGPDVVIGDNTHIAHNVVIEGNVIIGKDCIIKSNTIIGSSNFDFVYGEGRWEQFPQISQIVIKDHVWVGANTTIERGTLNNTIIESGVKIDDLVQIGGGSVIGERSIVTAGVIVCRGVTLGKQCWISPNACIIEGLSIGTKSTVGLGAVVIRDVLAGQVVAGNPAKPLVQRRK